MLQMHLTLNMTKFHIRCIRFCCINESQWAKTRSTSKLDIVIIVINPTNIFIQFIFYAVLSYPYLALKAPISASIYGQMWVYRLRKKSTYTHTNTNTLVSDQIWIFISISASDPNISVSLCTPGRNAVLFPSLMHKTLLIEDVRMQLEKEPEDSLVSRKLKQNKSRLRSIARISS